jgi:hypothetical protein
MASRLLVRVCFAALVALLVAQLSHAKSLSKCQEIKDNCMHDCCRVAGDATEDATGCRITDPSQRDDWEKCTQRCADESGRCMQQ